MSFKPLLIVLLLSGCATAPEYAEVKVPVDRFVEVPAELTASCSIAYDQPQTWGELALLALAALAALDKCDKQMDSIRWLK